MGARDELEALPGGADEAGSRLEVGMGDRFGLGREDAYAFCSTAVDLRVTQVVNGYKGAHAMLAKDLTPS